MIHRLITVQRYFPLPLKNKNFSLNRVKLFWAFIYWLSIYYIMFLLLLFRTLGVRWLRDSRVICLNQSLPNKICWKLGVCALKTRVFVVGVVKFGTCFFIYHITRVRKNYANYTQTLHLMPHLSDSPRVTKCIVCAANPTQTLHWTLHWGVSNPTQKLYMKAYTATWTLHKNYTQNPTLQPYIATARSST